MIVTGEVMVEGVQPGTRIDATDAPVRLLELPQPIGRVVSVRCTRPNWLVLTMELSDEAVSRFGIEPRAVG